MLKRKQEKDWIDREFKKMKKSERGITLVVLIITVVIMLILAAVTINVTLGEGGILDQARLAKALTTNSTQSEQEALNSLMQEFANVIGTDSEIPPPEGGGNNETGGGTEEPDVPDDIAGLKPGAGEPVEILENTTTVKDDLQNDVVIPGGFGIASDSGTKVEEGIVIQDGNGNQFVWIPTGTYNVSTTINSSGKLTNNLTRRTFSSGGATEVSGDSAIDDRYYGDTVTYTQISSFKMSAESTANGGKGGFYIGRYEQGEGNVIQAGVAPYVSITRNDAKTQAEAICSGNNNVESELISSYAWDTALNFICQTNVASGEGYNLAMTTSSTYANIGTNSIENTGAYGADNYSNIHDFLGNCEEWTTECHTDGLMPVVYRGGYGTSSSKYAAYREKHTTSMYAIYISLRTQLYVK